MYLYYATNHDFGENPIFNCDLQEMKCYPVPAEAIIQAAFSKEIYPEVHYPNYPEIHLYWTDIPDTINVAHDYKSVFLHGTRVVKTRELFHHAGTYTWFKQARIKGTCYSRFIFTNTTSDGPEVDRYVIDAVYGDADSFSVIHLDPDVAGKDEILKSSQEIIDFNGNWKE